MTTRDSRRRAILAAANLAGALLSLFSAPRAVAGERETSSSCDVGTGPKVVEFRDALITALGGQPQLVIAREELEKARANLTAALTPFLPSVVGSFADQRLVPRNGSAPVTVVGNQVIGGTETYSGYASLGLTWNILEGGKDIAGYRGAKAAKRATAAGLASQLNDTVSTLIQAYSDLFDAQRVLLEQRRTLALLEDIEARAEERLRNGNGTTIAVEQANSKALDTQRALFQACHSVGDKSAALANAAGLRLPAGFLLGVGSAVPDVESQVSAGLSDGDESLVEQDPAVVAAKENITVAAAKLRQAQAAYGPTISIVGRRDYLGQNPDSFGSANREISPNSYQIGIQVQQPILPFTAETSAVAAARADFREAQAKYYQATIDADGRVQQAWSTQQEADSSARATRVAVETAVRILTLTESVYKAGRTDLDNLQNARIGVEKAQSLNDRSLCDLNTANWTVYRAIHQGVFPAEVAHRVSLEWDPVSGEIR
jgi:outer membrane protein TolC